MPAANVQSIQALADLKGALNRFGGEAQEVLNAADIEIRRTLEWLEERRRHWQAEVRRCEAALQAAERALAACNRQPRGRSRDGNYDPPPNCRSEEAAARAAQRALAAAQAELHNVEHWLQQTQQAAAEYQRQARRLGGMLNQEMPRAAALLEQKMTTLESYVHLAPSGGAMFGMAPMLLNIAIKNIDRFINNQRSAAVRSAKRQEIALVQRAGRGTRDWNNREIHWMQKKGKFPKNYEGHHINSVDRFPEQAGNPDNIDFVKSRKISREHIQRHQGKFTNASSGRMFNRKSLMVQWSK